MNYIDHTCTHKFLQNSIRLFKIKLQDPTCAFFLNEGGSRISNITFPCVMKVMKATRISLYFFTFLCISLHFSAFLYISLHFSAFLWIFVCISLHFSSFLFISLNFGVFLGISLNFSALLYISLHFSTFCIFLKI